MFCFHHYIIIVCHSVFLIILYLEIKQEWWNFENKSIGTSFTITHKSHFYFTNTNGIDVHKLDRFCNPV